MKETRSCQKGIKKAESLSNSAFFNMVRKERLELSRREALEPKSSVSTNSTTPARNGEHYRETIFLVNTFFKVFKKSCSPVIPN